MSYDVLKDFQGAIAAIFTGGIGFYGVIRTLKNNAKIARDGRADAKLTAETALRSALLAELEYELGRYTTMASQFRESKSADILMPKDSPAVIYPTIFGRLELLSSEEIQSLVSSHSAISLTHFRAINVSNLSPKDDRLIVIPSKEFIALAGAFDGVTAQIRTTISVLERHKKLTPVG